ncbi:MAG TPA: AAA family ATPase [Actinobacteria bacterium]|nr:AAA family ATPase [Actinomycetota bacterium]
MSFEGIVGHDAVVAVLRGDLERPAHAYLFVGPAHVGKATVARRFAAALLCGEDPGCRRRVLERTHPDLVTVEPAGRSAITVDQARDLVAAASRSPYEADRQVFLLEEAGLLNDEAANALLKTLEEPSERTIFLLVAEAEDELPATVASRCRTVVFGRVPDEVVVEGLVASGVARDAAERVAVVAGGRPGLALALATRPEVAAFRALWLGLPVRLSEHPGEAYRLAEEVVEATKPLVAGLVEAGAAGDDDRAARRAADALYVGGLEILASFYRDAAAAQLGAPVRNRDVPVGALTVVSPRRAVANAERVFAAIDALEANQRPVLALASLFADLGRDG